jgi:hypothetical protein
MIEWNVQSRAHACQVCARPFAAQQPYHTLLFDEKLGYARLDLCEGCWAAQADPLTRERPGFVSRWQGIFELPRAVPEPIQKATAESLLRQLVELNDPRNGAACFILAVMLERKRLLKVREETRRDGLRVILYEHAQTGDLFTILHPDLRLDQLEEVQRDVARLLEHGLPPPASTGTPGDAPSAGTTPSGGEPALPQPSPPAAG